MELSLTTFGPSLLGGCCYEAERAQRVGMALEGLRDSLAEKYYIHINFVIDQVYTSSRLLRDLADKSQVHIARVPIVIDYLNVLLPCLSRSLMDITKYYEDRSISKERRWRTMWHEMAKELPGTTLPARFVMYNQFLCMLQHLLTKSPDFDMNGLESLRVRILQLREARDIPPPSPIQHGHLLINEGMDSWGLETNSHWAEAIFTQPLPSRSELDKPGREHSQAFGPLQRLGHVNISSDARILIKRVFDNDRLSVTFFLQGAEEVPYLLVRTIKQGEPWVSLRGAHELCISRSQDASLTLTRWSMSECRSKPWVTLYFITYEELVLFFCTFICLKARSTKTIAVDYKIKREEKLFQAQIVDDGYRHCLAVYQDKPTGRKRLHASVWDGEMKQCPVWTAFLPDATVSTRSWLLRKSNHKVWVRDIIPYVFCEKYRAHNIEKRPGTFELKFVKMEAALRFKEIFDPPAATITSSETTTTTTTTEQSADAPVPGPGEE